MMIYGDDDERFVIGLAENPDMSSQTRQRSGCNGGFCLHFRSNELTECC